MPAISPTTSAHVRPSLSATTLQKALLVCGVLSSVTYVLDNIVSGLTWHGYSFMSQTISELSAIDAPSRRVWIALGVVYGALLIAFGIGVWRSAENRRGLRIAGAMLIAIAVLGAFWPPMHLRGTVTTLTDMLHVVFAVVTSVMIFVTIGAGARALGRSFRLYSYVTIALLLVAGTLTFMYAPDLAANRPTPLLGFVERINLGLYLGWVAVLAVALLRRRDWTAFTDRQARS